MFGKQPSQLIVRSEMRQQIINSFLEEENPQQIYMISGIRGCGKTVFMTEIAKRMQEEDWIVVELNPEKDLLQGLASKLSSENNLAKIFRSANINLSFFGFGVEIKGVAPITDIETALNKMLSSLKKKGKKVLVCIDEVTSSEQMKIFAAAFQIFVRQDLPIYLLMTGLYENINRLQNEDSLTFLYRAPKIELGPLNIGAIANNYENSFNCSYDTALEMAKLTNGYSFAFQVLGYLTYENKGKYKEIIPEYKQYLEEYVYIKIWSELSDKDREVLLAIAKNKSGKVSEIKDILNISSNEFNPYRQRLIKKGVVDGNKYGYLRFTLPLFNYFVLENYDD